MVEEETEIDEEQELRLKFWAACEASGAKPDVAITVCAEILTNLITAHAPNLEGALRVLEHVVAMMGGNITDIYTRQREQMSLPQ
jgi:hypothetical protein